MPGPDHLLPEARRLLGASEAERISYVRRDKWLEYPAAAAALKAMGDLLERPNQTRQRGVLIAARPDNGKTALLRRFRNLNLPTTRESGEASMPVAVVWTPDEPSEAKLWSQVLKALKAPHRSSDSARHLKEQALDSMEALQVRMLMFDELHNLLLGSAQRTQHLLTLLKMLVNELSVRIVVAGTQEVVMAARADKQQATRFDGYGLPPWRENAQLRTLMKGLEATLPLPAPSSLDSADMMKLMITTADDAIGGFVVQVQRAAELAILAGHPCVTTDHIRKAQRSAGVGLANLAANDADL